MFALLVARAVALASHVLFLVILVLIAEGLARVAVQKARAVTRCVAKVFQVLLLAKAKRKEAVGGKRLPPGLSKRSKKQQARASTGGKRRAAQCPFCLAQDRPAVGSARQARRGVDAARLGDVTRDSAALYPFSEQW